MKLAKMIKQVVAIGIIILCQFACNNQPGTKIKTTAVPEWSKNAIWYQIFVERFRNGDSSNDPTRESLEGTFPRNVPESWSITPWTQQWFRKDKWFFEFPDSGFYYGNQARRYGGDLQGVLDKIEYLVNLGITAIYFNPLNDSPSLHKYDAAHYRHIDRHFGPNPKLDSDLMEQEDPIDPNTWFWTSADSLFLKVIDSCHKKGIRVILDYSWNHTGINFWAFKDVKEKGVGSDYADWFYIDSFDDPSTPEDEFAYDGWFGVEWMPEFREEVSETDRKKFHDEGVTLIEGNFHSQSAKQHIFNVSKRWLDPNNDGDPSDGVDGYRLDVAAEIPMGFWRDFKAMVKSINPEAYLIGEIWWKKWPDEILDPAPFLGEAFDAVMNYRWYRESRIFFSGAEGGMKASEFARTLDSISVGQSKDHQQVMMNLTASHDSPRVSTSLYNKNKYKYHAKMQDNLDYKTNKPDERTLKQQKMLLLHQFTYIGAPHIWMGDEAGMWGEDDPGNRKPQVWPDMVYEPETLDAQGNFIGKVDSVKFNHELHDFYKSLAALRKNTPVLINGNLKFIVTDDNANILVYSRFNKEHEVLVIFNVGDKEQTIKFKPKLKHEFKNGLANSIKYKTIDGKLTLKIEGQSGLVLTSMRP